MARFHRRFRRANPLAGDAPRLPLRATFVLFSILFVALLALTVWYALRRASTEDLRHVHGSLGLLVPAQATVLGFLMTVTALIVGQTRARTEKLTAPGADLMRRIAALKVRPQLASLRADYVAQLERHGSLPDGYRRAGMSAYPDSNVVHDVGLLDRLAGGRAEAGRASTNDTRADNTTLFRVAYTVLLSPAVQRDYANTRLRDLSGYVADLMRDHDLVYDVDAAFRVRRGALMALLSLLVLMLLWLATILVVAVPFSPGMRVAYALTATWPFVFVWTAAYYMYQVIRVYMAER